MELVAEKELSAYSRFTRGKYETAPPCSLSSAGPACATASRNAALPLPPAPPRLRQEAYVAPAKRRVMPTGCSVADGERPPFPPPLAMANS